jgi:hypothetical protein
MYAPQPSAQAVRLHQAKHQQSLVRGQVQPIRSMTVPSAQRLTGAVAPAEQPWGLRADTPHQDDGIPRREPQRPYAAARNYQNAHSRQSSVSSSGPRQLEPIPAWVDEMNVPKPQRIRSTFVRNEAFDSHVDEQKVPPDVGTPVEKTTLRRDSATLTHAELYYGEEGSGSRKAAPVYETRSDAYRNIDTKVPVSGSGDAFWDAQARIRRQEEDDMRRRTDSYTPAETYQRDINTVSSRPQPTTTSLRRLSLRLPADLPLSEDMFDGITGDVDVGEVFGSVTANILSEMDVSDASVSGYLVNSVVEGKEKKVRGKEDDFRWIRPAIQRS